MSDNERGAYTPPTDAPLAFEARQPVRGARPFPVTLIISVLVLLGLAAAMFVVYRSGVRQAGGAPPAVGTPIGEMKAPAPPESQPQDPAAGLEIYRSENGQPPQMAPAQPQFTPPPEQPQARPVGPPVVLAPAVPATQAPPSQPAAQAGTPALRPAQPAPAPTQVAVAPAKPPVVIPPPKPAAPTTKATAVNPPPKPAAEKTKPVEKTPAPVAAKASAAVQIGAVSSPALADKTWNEAVAVAPGLAAGKGKGVEKVVRDGKTLYRTSVTGFASREAAQAFCAKLKAAGKACFVK